MPSATKTDFITETDYLAGEHLAQIKHEYVDGYIYAMAGASKNHDAIALNMAVELSIHLKNSPCRPFSSDIKVKTAAGNFRYPDCMVVCDDQSDNEYYTNSPVIIVEVLSRSTRKTDEKDKLIEYINIPSLQEYVIIEQDIADITVYRKSDNWRSTHYFLGESIYFESIDFSVPVETLYHRVNNPDVDDFLQLKAQTSVET